MGDGHDGRGPAYSPGFVCTPPSLPPQLARRVPQAPRAGRYLLAYAAATPAVRARVLESFFNLDPEATDPGPAAAAAANAPATASASTPLPPAGRAACTPHEAQLVVVAARAAAAALSLFPSELGRLPLTEMARALTAFTLNGHAYQAGTGLFELGSKVRPQA